MKPLFLFLLELEKLKGKVRRGWLLHKIKNGETTAEHIFHLAFLTWVLGREKKLNMEKMLKIALLHDIAEIYAPDLTSYDACGIKKGITIKNWKKIKPKEGRPTNEQRKILARIKRKLEERAMKKITKKLPADLKREFKLLWFDYQNGLSKESRFVKQADRFINFFQGMIYSKKCKKIKKKLWLQRIKEVIDDEYLLDLLKTSESYFFKK